MPVTLDLTLTDNNTATWTVWLDVKDLAHQVLQWNGGPGTFTKTIPNFSNGKNTVTVFVACTGWGASASCDVAIDGVQQGTINANFNDPVIAHQAFPI